MIIIAKSSFLKIESFVRSLLCLYLLPLEIKWTKQFHIKLGEKFYQMLKRQIRSICCGSWYKIIQTIIRTKICKKEVGLPEINAKSSLENTNNLNGFQLIIFFHIQTWYTKIFWDTSSLYKFHITFIKTNPGEWIYTKFQHLEE